MQSSSRNSHHRPGPRRRRRVARPVPPARPEPEEAEPQFDRLAYRPNEAAMAIGVSSATMERMIREKTIRSFKHGGVRFVRVEAIKQWLMEMEEAEAA